MTTLPKLYKKTTTGAIQTWQISIDGPWIITDFGQLDSPNMQQTRDLIREGKNAGKRNATTPEEQAVAEARSKWEAQKKKKGYVESIEDARAGKVDALVKGGLDPMLAHSFAKQAHKIKYPAYVQPKLDGIRCIAIVENGICTLWSRTRQPITSLPHIVAELEEKFATKNVIIDGELYNHAYKARFSEIVSYVRQELAPHENHKEVQYHIYDLVGDDLFEDRYRYLNMYFFGANPYLKAVKTEIVNDESEVLDWFETFRKEGYEGAIVRNAKGRYVGRRSYDLQKVKDFDADEFDIVGIEEGRGKLMGHVGKFVCRMKNGKEFKAKLKGELAFLKECLEDHSLWENKKMTVQYQGFTDSDGLPRIPVGVIIRDYE